MNVLFLEVEFELLDHFLEEELDEFVDFTVGVYAKGDDIFAFGKYEMEGKLFLSIELWLYSYKLHQTTLIFKIDLFLTITLLLRTALYCE